MKSLQMRIDDTLRVSHKAISLHSNVILSNKNDNSHIHNVITKACFIIMLQISESEILIGVDDWSVPLIGQNGHWMDIIFETQKVGYLDFIFLESFWTNLTIELRLVFKF